VDKDLEPQAAVVGQPAFDTMGALSHESSPGVP